MSFPAYPCNFVDGRVSRPQRSPKFCEVNPAHNVARQKEQDMQISYRNRLVIKRHPESLDPDEVGVVFDKSKSEFYICPPDLSSKNIDDLVERWTIFLLFAEELPNIDLSDLWFGRDIQKEAFFVAANQYVTKNRDNPNHLCEKIIQLTSLLN